jgi:hypothetical protein
MTQYLELISLEKRPQEDQNFIVLEPSVPSIGDKFIVVAEFTNRKGDTWVELEDLEYAHPIEKFRRCSK